MNIISQILENENNKSFSINKFFKENNISGIMKQCNFNKEKGIKSIIVFKLIFILLFTNKSLLFFARKKCTKLQRKIHNIARKSTQKMCIFLLTHC